MLWVKQCLMSMDLHVEHRVMCGLTDGQSHRPASSMSTLSYSINCWACCLSIEAPF